MTQAQATVLVQMEPYNPDTEQWSIYSERLEQFFYSKRHCLRKENCSFSHSHWYNNLHLVVKPDKPSEKATMI